MLGKHSTNELHFQPRQLKFHSRILRSQSCRKSPVEPVGQLLSRCFLQAAIPSHQRTLPTAQLLGRFLCCSLETEQRQALLPSKVSEQFCFAKTAEMHDHASLPEQEERYIVSRLRDVGLPPATKAFSTSQFQKLPVIPNISNDSSLLCGCSLNQVPKALSVKIQGQN